MSTELTCPVCTAINAFAADQGGRMGKCGKCGAPMYIPRREEMPPPISSITRFHGRASKPGGGMTRTVVVVTAVVAVLVAAVGGYFLFVPRNSALGEDDKNASKVTDPFAAPQVVTVAASASASQEGDLADAKSENVFKLKAPSAGTLIVYIDPAAGSKLDGQLVALDAQRKEITRNESDADKRISQIQFPVAASQDYYLKVAGFDGTSGKYKLTFAHVTNVSNNFNTAVEVRLTRTGVAAQSWRLDYDGDEDMFRLVAPVTGMMHASMVQGPGSTLDGRPSAYNSTWTAIGQGGPDWEVRFYVEKGKTYYVKAGSWQPPNPGRTRTGPYTLNIWTVKGADDYGNDFATAFKVPLNASGGATLPGQIETESDVDFFTFQAPKTGNMNINLTMPFGSMLDAGLYTYDNARLSLGAGTGPRFTTLFVVQGMTYYVKVAPKPAPSQGMLKTGAYTLNFTMPNGMGGGNQPVDFNNAQQVTLDGSGAAKVSGQLDNEWATKVFRFEATQSGLLVAEVAPGFGSNLAGGASAYSSGKLPIGPAGSSKFLEFVVTAGNTYYVRVAAFSFPPPGMQKTGAYTLLLRTEKTPPDDYGNDFTTAHEIFLSPAGTATVSGRIEVPADQDFFRIKAPDTGWLEVYFQNPFGNLLDGKLNVYDDLRREQQLPMPVQKGQYYYVKVSSWSPPLYAKRSTGPYGVSLRFAKTLPDDYGNDFATAFLITLFNTGSTFRSGRIETSEDVDFFRFKATATGSLNITLMPGMGSRFNSHVYVYDENQNLLKDTNQGFNRFMQVQVEAGKTYYVKVAANKNAPTAFEMIGWYSLEIRPLTNK